MMTYIAVAWASVLIGFVAGCWLAGATRGPR